MWPLIVRELRGSSRRWSSYWLRLIGPALMILAVFLGSTAISTSAGSETFARMHRFVIGALWVIVPLLACDCLSREKREGTLSLLFLTTLSGRQIVLAKMFAHGLCALTLWLATVPVIGLPMLLGGLTWREIVISCCFAVTSICFALGAAVIGSSISRKTTAAVGLTVVLSGAGYLSYAFLCVSIGVLVQFFLTGMPVPQTERPSFNEMMDAGFDMVFNSGNCWSGLLQAQHRTLVFWTLVSFVLVSILALGVIVQVCGWIITRNWQDRPKSKQRQEWEDAFCEPFLAVGLFRRWMRRTLDRNPIGWLEQRHWTGRMVALIWLAVVICMATGVFSYAQLWVDEGMIALNVVMVLLLITIAYVSAGSFRRERETGAMELILVTPLKESQIVSGRLRGLWLHFLPTMLIWFAVKLHACWILHGVNRDGEPLAQWDVLNSLELMAAFFIVPMVGLSFSLRSRHVLLAWVATLLSVYALPQLLVRIGSFIWRLWSAPEAGSYEHTILLVQSPLITIALQVAVAWFLISNLHRRLVRRTFELRVA